MRFGMFSSKSKSMTRRIDHDKTVQLSAGTHEQHKRTGAKAQEMGSTPMTASAPKGQINTRENYNGNTLHLQRD